MPKIGIIGGSALDVIADLEVSHREMVNTPYGATSSPLLFGKMDGGEIVFIHRHGFGHTIAPHEINYRANIWALRELEVTHIIATAAVGGITDHMSPKALVIPDQIIDYTHTRNQTFYENSQDPVVHVDFTWPYDEQLRTLLNTSAVKSNMPVVSRGTYGAVQGPRLETAAEIKRLEGDGCDIVGMTAMPETVLARELDMKYACCAMVVNWAAGKGSDDVSLHESINNNLKAAQERVHKLLSVALPEIIKL
ncbi:MAG: S-methyl-5'-thioinosine phosphorylase [Gammaproteobacteria bacterium]|jgi:5'-methylthioinosine phosphorylase